VGAGAGASTLAGSAGASSFFLQPTTDRDKEATNSTATKMANTFFINGKPPFKDFQARQKTSGLDIDGEEYAFFLPCQAHFL